MSNDGSSDGVGTSLNQFGNIDYTPPRYPSAFEADHEVFIQRLRSDVDQLANNLLASFPAFQSSSGVYIQFGRSTSSNFESFIESSPRLALKALLSACQLTRSSVEDEFEISLLNRTFDDELKTDIDNPELQDFIYLCMSQLSGDRHIESILLPYFRHRERHERSKEFYLYSEVHDELSDDDFSISRGSDIAGSPNVIISESGIDHSEGLPDGFVAVTAVDATRHEVLKRAKVAVSRLKDTQSQHPGCSRVLFFRVRSFPTNTDDEVYKAQKREEMFDLSGDVVDRIFFMSEFDDFEAYCRSIVSESS